MVVLEAGGDYEDADFDGGEAPAFERLYADGGAASTSDGGIGLLAGACLGGGTVVNYTTSFRTPDAIRAEWAAHGLPAFASAAYDGSLDAVCRAARRHARAHRRRRTRDGRMARGLDALGWHVDAMPRNVRGCDRASTAARAASAAGCGAKQSTVRTWLADAAAAGARILVRTRARAGVVRDGRRAASRRATAGGHRVACAPGRSSSAAARSRRRRCCARSGLATRNVGRRLRLHPVTAVFGVFEEELRPWEGTMQALYSDEHARPRRRGYGVKYETGPMNPSQLLTFAPFRTRASRLELVAGLSRTGVVGVLAARPRAGEVHGRPRRRADRGVPDLAARRGATRGRESRAGRASCRPRGRGGSSRRTSKLVEWRAARGGSLDAFVAAGDARGYASGRCAYVSFHIMGSARMGGSPAMSACNPDGETWEVRDLVVCDGSLFPTASGVNPMISIEALAHLNARRLAARLSA